MDPRLRREPPAAQAGSAFPRPEVPAVRNRATLVLLCLALAAPSAAERPACGTAEHRRLDFWLGSWDLTWEGGTGRNVITRELNGCVIREDFTGEMPDGPYHGHSDSMYDVQSGTWRQTWVDDRGNFLVFTGGVDDAGVMRLHGEPRTAPDGTTIRTRMSWVNVSEDALDWHWERSTDDGATWEMVWAIHYARASGADPD